MKPSMKLEQTVKLVHLLIAVGITVFGGAATAGMAWSSINSKVEQTGRKVDDIADDRKRTLLDYYQWRDKMNETVTDTRARLLGIEDNIKRIRDAVERKQ